MIGTVISHYRILERIGSGSFGVVYKALDLRLERTVAIKLVQRNLLNQTRVRERFIREARSASTLNHPNVCVVHEIGEEDGQPFICMEYVEGTTLRRRLQARPLTIEESVSIATKLVDALSTAHDLGLIHRDIKPENVMLTPTGQLKLMDFGLAKIVDPERDSASHAPTALTLEGQVMGTVPYMSPEQLRGDSADQRSDVYSFGVLLYEMITGRRPFEGGTPGALLERIMAAEPLPLTRFQTEIPEELQRIAMRCLARTADTRYQDIKDLKVELQSVASLDVGRATEMVPDDTASPPSTARTFLTRAVAAVFIAAVGWIIVDELTEESGAPRSVPSIAVVGFEILQDTNDLKDLDRMLMSLVTKDLVESGELEVLSMPRVLSARRRVTGQTDGNFDLATAQEVASTAGADLIVVGQIGESGGRLVLTAELIDVESGNTLASCQELAASREELFSTSHSIASRARRTLEVDSSPVDLTVSFTNSPAAFRHYTIGELAFHEHRFEAAIEAFSQAIEADSTFAMGYYRLAQARGWLGTRAAWTVLEQGRAHIDRLPPHWRSIYEALGLYQRAIFAEAHEILSAVLDQRPDVPDVHYLLGEIAEHAPRFQDPRLARQHFQRAFELDPTFTVSFEHLVADCLAQGDLPAAHRLIGRYQKIIPADRVLSEPEIQVLAATGNYKKAVDRAVDLWERGHTSSWLLATRSSLEGGYYQRALAICDQVIPVSTQNYRHQAFADRGLAKIQCGKLEDGLDDLRRATEVVEAEVPSWFSHFAASYQTVIAQVLAATRRHQQAQVALEQAIRLEPYFYPAYYWSGCIGLSFGDESEAERARRELTEIARQASPPTARFWLQLLNTELALHRGDISAAAAALARAEDLRPEYRERRVEAWVRARVRTAQKEHEAALAAYRDMGNPRHRATQWEYRLLTLVPATRSLCDMAALEEQLGHRESAQEHYREFLDRWGSAATMVSEVKHAQQRLTALEAE